MLYRLMEYFLSAPVSNACSFFTLKFKHLADFFYNWSLHHNVESAGVT